MKLALRVASALLTGFISAAAWSSTWYVRPDGGTRYSTEEKSGQCDGQADAPYTGKGTNQHCAFKDVRSLWSDASYNYGNKFPGWGWVGEGGDTYIIRGSIAEKVSYRVGWNSPSKYCDGSECWGITGDPYHSGAPTPPSGTAAQHTRILGGNFENCHAQTARTQLHGGYGVSVVLNMAGASYVDVACLDITDFSNCGKASQTAGCNPGGVLADYASNGIQWSNKSTHDTVTDVRIHGMASAGMLGPTGDGIVMSHIDILGNPSSGWNADASDGTTGSGSLLVEHYNISWNGCAEEYPIADPLPYGDCTDQDSGGYGDGFGTASVASNPPWKAHFDQGVVSYNTQDGLDALHLTGPGSSMTITRTLAYGNMGQQIKFGGAVGAAINNLIVGNCEAMRQPIPGTPPGYNKKLGLFCRAGNGAVFVATGQNALSAFDFNTIISANSVGLVVLCDNSDGPCDKTSKLDYRNNIFVGHRDDAADGNPNGSGENPTPIYMDDSLKRENPFANAGSSFSGNATFKPRSNWTCPAEHELKAICGDPKLVDERWHLYGYGNMAPSSSTSPVVKSGVPITGISVDYAGAARGPIPSRGALEFTGTIPASQIRADNDPSVARSAPASRTDLGTAKGATKWILGVMLLLAGAALFRGLKHRSIPN